MEDTAIQPAVLLIATEGEWAGRSLESVLVANGYAVLRAADGADAIALTRRYRPDGVILDEHLPGIGGIDVCRSLRDDKTFDASTPIVITAPAPAARATRNAAYEAGAWEFCTHPVDADVLLLKLSTFLRAKHVLAEAREKTMLDEPTGVLSPAGLERWAEHVAARAARNHESLACVVLMPSESSRGASASVEDDTVTKSVASFLQLSRNAFRRSDIVGRTPDGRLALLAPETDAEGVKGMIARLRGALAEAEEEGRTTVSGLRDFKAGYWAVQDFASAPLEAPELLRRAARALDHIANPTPGSLMAIGFDQLPLS